MNYSSIDRIKKPYLNWHDFAKLFDCRRNKAMLLMHEVGVLYIGSEAFVETEKLKQHLDQHGEIRIKWPRRKAAKNGQ